MKVLFHQAGVSVSSDTPFNAKLLVLPADLGKCVVFLTKKESQSMESNMGNMSMEHIMAESGLQADLRKMTGGPEDGTFWVGVGASDGAVHEGVNVTVCELE